MSAIRLEEISKSFAPGRPALDRLSLEIAPGEILAVLGPSGSGKTTLLRLIAGLEQPDAGRLELHGRSAAGLPPAARDIGMVFQSPALYPHLSVFENIAFPLRLRNVAKGETTARVQAVAEQLGIAALLARRPAGLSGGEAQRVALARAWIRRPAILLLDEPFSSLPPDTRLALRRTLKALHRNSGATIVYVTHDHEEAMATGDRLAVLHEGRLLQLDTPETVHAAPAHSFVARFIGRPAMNLVPAPDRPTAAPAPPRPDALFGLRPERVLRCETAEALLTAAVTAVEFTGPCTDVYLQVGSTEFTARWPGRHLLTPGASLPLRWETRDVHWFDAASGLRLNPGP